MELIICAGVNVPCAALGLMINLFYVICLTFPLGQPMNIRQPLITLLVLLIFCTSLFQVSLIFNLIFGFFAVCCDLQHAVDAFIFYAVRVSIPTTLWLNLFYCTQIVPGRTACFKWLKRNIRLVVYMLIIFTKFYFLVYYILELMLVRDLDPQVNSTIETEVISPPMVQVDQFLDTLDAVTMTLVFLGLVTMLALTGTMVSFLYQHIKKMTKNGTNVHTQLLRKQVRVSITGLVQGVLYMLCSVGMFLDLYCTFHRYSCDKHVLWTIFTVYSLATTINLGVGQSLFRHRIVQLWNKVETRFSACVLKSAPDNCTKRF